MEHSLPLTLVMVVVRVAAAVAVAACDWVVAGQTVGGVDLVQVAGLEDLAFAAGAMVRQEAFRTWVHQVQARVHLDVHPDVTFVFPAAPYEYSLESARCGQGHDRP